MHFISPSFCSFFLFHLKDVEHNIENLYCSHVKKNVIIAVIYIGVVSEPESIL